jgi:hypothetical protein
MTTADAIVDALLTESFVGWHSSPNSFRRFNTDREGAHFGTREQADNLRKPGKKAAKPYVVDIKNPLRVRDMGTWTLDGIATELLMQDVITQADYDAIREEFLWTDERGFAKLKAVLAALGYDGFVYDNEQEGQGDSYVAFYSKQIKPYRMAESLDDFDPKEFAMQPSVIYRHPVWDVTPQAIRDFFRAKGFQVRQVRRRTRGALVVMLRKTRRPPITRRSRHWSGRRGAGSTR